MGKELDTKDAAVLRKMERIRKSYDRTLNLARFKTLAGQQWAPNGTVTVDFFSDFGLTQNNVNFALVRELQILLVSAKKLSVVSRGRY